MWHSEGCVGCYEQYKCRNLIWICTGGWSESLPCGGDTWATVWRQRVGLNKAEEWEGSWWWRNSVHKGSKVKGSMMGVQGVWEMTSDEVWILFSFYRDGNWGSAGIYPQSYSRVVPGSHHRDCDWVRIQPDFKNLPHVLPGWELLLSAC